MSIVTVILVVYYVYGTFVLYIGTMLLYYVYGTVYRHYVRLQALGEWGLSVSPIGVPNM
jgi:hypothetical protein